jgi:hypothetical protein
MCLKLLAVASCLTLLGCPRAARLSVSETSHNFGTAGTTFQFTVSNSGSRGTTLVFDVAADRAWLELDVTGGESTGEDDPVMVTVTLNRDPAASKIDFNTGTVTVTSSVGDKEISITATPDYFTEVFEGDFDLENTTLIFTEDSRFDPDPALNFYDAMHADAAEFVTDPEGGTIIDFDGNANGDPATVPLFFNETLDFYGVVYDTVYVGSGGYVAFDNGTAPETAGTLEEHFAAPEVSALGTGLDPAQGTVSVLQSADRLAVTYEDMVEVGLDSVSNFQIELFFEGGVQVTYLDVGATDAIAGLSIGEGLPTDFVETDFNSDTIHTTESLRSQL